MAGNALQGNGQAQVAPVGAGSAERLVAYLASLTGEQLALDTKVRLRSVQRAAFSSWVRQQQMQIKLAAIMSSVPFCVRELLEDEAGTPVTTLAPTSALQSKVALVAPASVSLQAPERYLGAPSVGIDIEEVENLPETYDFREHPFYQDNFTPAEISFCVQQPDVRASFCGTWAAKEAIFKAGVGSAPGGHLKSIEILRDAAGRPLYQGCSISISHTPRTAVAVCYTALS